MRSAKPGALMRPLILSLTMLAVAACAGGPRIVAAPNAPCSSLVPDSLRADVEPVDMPSRVAPAGEVWTALDGQTGRLDVANGNKRAGLEIVEKCEARDAAALNRLTRPWYAFWR